MLQGLNQPKGKSCEQNSERAGNWDQQQVRTFVIWTRRARTYITQRILPTRKTLEPLRRREDANKIQDSEHTAAKKTYNTQENLILECA